MVSQVEQFCAEGDRRCCFLSVPSIYFSMKDKVIKSACKCLDVSTAFCSEMSIVWRKIRQGSEFCVLRLQQAGRYSCGSASLVPPRSNWPSLHHERSLGEIRIGFVTPAERGGWSCIPLDNWWEWSHDSRINGSEKAQFPAFYTESCLLIQLLLDVWASRVGPKKWGDSRVLII